VIAHNPWTSQKRFHHGCKGRSASVKLLRLDRRLISRALSRQVKVIAFCDLWLTLDSDKGDVPNLWEYGLPVFLLKEGLPNVCASWLSPFLLVDDIPSFWYSWLPVGSVVDAYYKGLHNNDFIMAAKSDELVSS